MTEHPPSELCGEGRQILSDLNQQNQAIAQTNLKVAECHRAQDSMDRQVPRSLHDDLKAKVNQRAMGQMQWRHHTNACLQCSRGANA
jgi:hypothetical protein